MCCMGRVHPNQTGKNAYYAEYVWHSGMIALKILEGIWDNKA